MIAAVVYVLCAVTSVFAAVLLVRAYRESRSKLIFWSAVCFVGFALSNVVLVVDLLAVPDVDLSLWHRVPNLLAVLALVYGLVTETSR